MLIVAGVTMQVSFETVSSIAGSTGRPNGTHVHEFDRAALTKHHGLGGFIAHFFSHSAGGSESASETSLPVLEMVILPLSPRPPSVQISSPLKTHILMPNLTSFPL
jgi:hypothetical protein